MKKLLSKIISYLSVFFVNVFLIDFFDGPLWTFFLAIPLVPLVLVPFEIFSLMRWGTTIRKALLGKTHSTKLSFKEAFAVSWRTHFWMTLLTCPPLSIIFYILGRKNTKIKAPKIRSRFPKKFTYTCLVALQALCFSLPLFPERSKNFLQSITQLEMPYKEDSLEFNNHSWFQIMSDKPACEFVVSFPQEPAFKKEKYPVPNSQDSIVYQEYSHDTANMQYSLGYIQVPSKWTLFGSYPVFKGALGFLYEMYEVVQKDKAKHGSYPAMQYKLKFKKEEIFGKFVLVKKTLYRIEARKTGTFTPEEIEQSKEFFNSFQPHPSQR